MAKQTTKFICNGCGAEYVRWQGKCDQCGQWETLVETIVTKQDKGLTSRTRVAGTTSVPQSLASINTEKVARIKTGIGELDSVLGGGIVPGSLVLLGGDPGIGKSTLLLQAVAGIAKANPEKELLYVSGEESAQQIKLRADRLAIGSKTIHILPEQDLDTIIATIEQQKPLVVIVDSVQTTVSAEIASGAGSIAQVKHVTESLMQIAKSTHTPIILIGHVTKDGGIAGPKTLEHLVDAVLYLEGDRYQSFRVLRGIKNRFGKTSEVGIFEMIGEGMSEVKNPSQVFLEERLANTSGAAITSIIEGNRPFLVEIQALASRSYFGYPKRTASGIDLNRLNLLIAVIEKRAALDLGQFDVYLNVVGGIKIRDQGTDLAAALAIISASKNKPISATTAIFGELGLSGEVRSVPHLEVRIAEAIKLGFTTLILPRQKQGSTIKKDTNIKVIEVRSLKEAMDAVL
ncbi:MAG: DNA repair protein RadA [Patescibacteria group bacterium]